jgi:peptidoglycan/LPS O-acetylase OafA/YrhL
LSIILVVLGHIAMRVPFKDDPLSAHVPKAVRDGVLTTGYEAVFIFFVISGFLIASNAQHRWGSLGAIQLHAFWLRRAARILPCLLLLVTVLSVMHWAGARDFVIQAPGQSLQGAIFAALSFHINWYEAQLGYLPASWDVLWSLAIEEVFYLGFPVLCVLLRKEWALALFLTTLASSLPFMRTALVGNDIWLEKAYLPGMAAIAAGVLGALIVKRVPLPPRYVVIMLGLLGIAGIIAVLFFSPMLWRILKHGLMLVLVLSALCIVLASHWQQARRAVLSFPGVRIFASFGQLSYEIYLTHMFVVLALAQVFAHLGVSPQLTLVWYALTLMLSWALGRTVAHAISDPSRRALLRLGSRPQS